MFFIFFVSIVSLATLCHKHVHYLNYDVEDQSGNCTERNIGLTLALIDQNKEAQVTPKFILAEIGKKLRSRPTRKGYPAS